MSRPLAVRACIIAGPVLIIGIAAVLVLARWRPGWLLRPLPASLVVSAVPALPRLKSDDLDAWRASHGSAAITEATARALIAGGTRGQAGLAVLQLAQDLTNDPVIDRALVALANGADLPMRKAARDARGRGSLSGWVRDGLRAGGRTSTTPWWGGGDLVDPPAWDAFALDLFVSVGYDDRRPSKYRKDVIGIISSIHARQTDVGALDPRLEVHLLQMGALACVLISSNSPGHAEVLTRAWGWCEAQREQCRWGYDTTRAYLRSETLRVLKSCQVLTDSDVFDDAPPDPRLAVYMLRGTALPDYDGDARILALSCRAWAPHQTTIDSDLVGLTARTLVARQALTLARAAVSVDKAFFRNRAAILQNERTVSTDELDGTWPSDADNDSVCATLAALYELTCIPRWAYAR